MEFNEACFIDYLVNESKMTEYRAKENLEGLKKYPDILAEFFDYINSGTFAKNPVTVEGYTAEMLYNMKGLSVQLSPAGAFNYLKYLRNDPGQALKNLAKGLPNKDRIPQKSI